MNSKELREAQSFIKHRIHALDNKVELKPDEIQELCRISNKLLAEVRSERRAVANLSLENATLVEKIANLTTTLETLRSNQTHTFKEELVQVPIQRPVIEESPKRSWFSRMLKLA